MCDIRYLLVLEGLVKNYKNELHTLQYKYRQLYDLYTDLKTERKYYQNKIFKLQELLEKNNIEYDFD